MKLPAFLKYNKDFTFNMGRRLATILPGMIPGRIDGKLPNSPDEEHGDIGAIFKETTNIRDGQFSCAIAVGIERGEEFLKLMLAEAAKHKKIPSMFSLRFVKKSKATLAFTKYDTNCLFGIDGMETKATKKFIKKISEILIAKDFPHTWHWGKFNYMDRAFVKKAYAESREEWITERMKIFSDSRVAQAFTNDYLNGKGLT